MDIEKQTDLLKELYSKETSEDVQPNFADVKNVSDNIALIVAISNLVLDNVLQTVNDNIDDIVVNANQSDNITVLANMSTILQSLYTDKTKLDTIFSNLFIISTVASNIVDIQNAEENAQTAINARDLAEQYKNDALQAKDDAQAIAGGTVFANIVEFSDLLKLDTWRTSTDSAISAINTLLTSNDTTLDELQEIVDYIKQNKSDLQTLGIANIAGLVDALNNKADASQKLQDISNVYVSTSAPSGGVDGDIWFEREA